ncbi:hypothetical protein F8388_026936 [Cannabis sativa]|uniref:Piwi domain-containing protein n=1 Tax=Cannabis sativa TaxID=3483 RepID=A0A7J6H1Z1_CANSA|nr:hypothetical protein F8388_026936 [Cannabis sativa]
MLFESYKCKHKEVTTRLELSGPSTLHIPTRFSFKDISPPISLITHPKEEIHVEELGGLTSRQDGLRGSSYTSNVSFESFNSQHLFQPSYGPDVKFLNHPLFQISYLGLSPRWAKVLVNTMNTWRIHPHDWSWVFQYSTEDLHEATLNYSTWGTSRPTHYHVLYDENKFNADDLQSMQVAKPICVFSSCDEVPLAYYAHLVAFRARDYIDRDGNIPAIHDNVKNLMSMCMQAPPAYYAHLAAFRTQHCIDRDGSLPTIHDNVKNLMFYVGSKLVPLALLVSPPMSSIPTIDLAINAEDET